MAKYKVGDRVRIVNHRTKYMSIFGNMDKWFGKTMTIRTILPAGYHMVEDREENCCEGWYWDDDMIAGLAEPGQKKESDLRVVIRFDGNVTTARMIRGGTVVKTAYARRNPSDDYSHAKGAALAVERLFCKKSDDKPKESSEPKIGGKFVVIGNEHTPHHCFKKGEIITIAAYHVKKSYIFENECGKRQHVNELDVKPYKGESK